MSRIGELCPLSCTRLAAQIPYMLLTALDSVRGRRTGFVYTYNTSSSSSEPGPSGRGLAVAGLMADVDANVSSSPRRWVRYRPDGAHQLIPCRCVPGRNIPYLPCPGIPTATSSPPHLPSRPFLTTDSCNHYTCHYSTQTLFIFRPPRLSSFIFVSSRPPSFFLSSHLSSTKRKYESKN